MAQGRDPIDEFADAISREVARFAGALRAQFKKYMSINFPRGFCTKFCEPSMFSDKRIRTKSSTSSNEIGVCLSWLAGYGWWLD